MNLQNLLFAKSLECECRGCPEREGRGGLAGLRRDGAAVVHAQCHLAEKSGCKKAELAKNKLRSAELRLFLPFKVRSDFP